MPARGPISASNRRANSPPAEKREWIVLSECQIGLSRRVRRAPVVIAYSMNQPRQRIRNCARKRSLQRRTEDPIQTRCRPVCHQPAERQSCRQTCPTYSELLSQRELQKDGGLRSKLL